MISIHWGTKVISIPQAFLTLVSAGLYDLDVDAFRLALKGLEDGEEGVAFPDTHRHNTVVSLSGVTYARTFEIINGYTITFEGTGTPYTVRCSGANHNLADVTNFVSEVSLIVGNSAGLIQGSGGGSGATPAEIWAYASRTLTEEVAPSAAENATAIWGHASALALIAKQAVLEKLLRNKTVTDPTTGIMTVYDDDGTTVLFSCNVFENAAGTQAYRGQGAERREKLV